MQYSNMQIENCEDFFSLEDKNQAFSEENFFHLEAINFLSYVEGKKKRVKNENWYQEDEDGEEKINFVKISIF